jgi:hypothetical protein
MTHSTQVNRIGQERNRGTRDLLVPASKLGAIGVAWLPLRKFFVHDALQTDCRATGEQAKLV